MYPVQLIVFVVLALLVAALVLSLALWIWG